jgi:predicted RNase H-like nuclease (RuvC/YqgF family)
MPFSVGKIVFQSPFVTRKPGDVIEIKEKENIVVSTFRKTVEGQRQTIIQLQRKIDDLGAQNEELRKSITITPQQVEAFKNQSQYVISLQTQLDQLALWLRENKAVEISRGEHNGQELIPLILKYLGGTLPPPLKPETEGKVN